MIELYINKKPIRLKEFPQKAFENTILGFISALNLDETPKEINIIIKEHEDTDNQGRSKQ